MNFSSVEEIIKRGFYLAVGVKFRTRSCEENHNILGGPSGYKK
jgi:hypothetical protein